MPTIDDAHLLAKRSACAESLRTGRPWRGFVEEFRRGWAVWAVPPPGEQADVGSGAKTVLDKETGHVSLWPPWPTETLADEYVSGSTRTIEPGRLPLLPLFEKTAWLEAPDGRVWWRQSALTDDPPELHPLLTQWLAEQPSLVRGAGRHAELLVLSQALCEAEASALAGSSTRPTSTRPCDTCLQAYVHFGVFTDTTLALVTPRRGTLTTDVPSFPDGRSFDPRRWAQIAFDLLAPDIAPVEAARRAIERYPFAQSTTRGPGRDCWIRPFQLGVTRSMTGHAPALAGFAELMRAVLYPLGIEDQGDGLIVIDGHGQVFVVDQAGAWWCGHDIETALVTLAEGHSPPRVRADGSWER